MSILVVTGTDTDVGKTVVTAAIAARRLATGDTVAVVKPAQTGVGPHDDGDLAEVRRLAGELSLHEGVRLPDLLAPDTAARVAGMALPSLQEQAGLVTRAADDRDLTIVEGAGGILVNLGENWTLLDLADVVRRRGHDVACVVVVRAGLGTLNHATLTVRAIQARGIEVTGLVVGAWPAEPGPAEVHNLEDLPRLTGVPVLGRVPEKASALPVEEFRRQARGWLAGL